MGSKKETKKEKKKREKKERKERKKRKSMQVIDRKKLNNFLIFMILCRLGGLWMNMIFSGLVINKKVVGNIRTI